MEEGRVYLILRQKGGHFIVSLPLGSSKTMSGSFINLGCNSYLCGLYVLFVSKLKCSDPSLPILLLNVPRAKEGRDVAQPYRRFDHPFPPMPQPHITPVPPLHNQQQCHCKPTSSLTQSPRLIRQSHLLGKKSWNVYNPAAIARVRADEAAAAAREEAEEQAQQEYDAARRLALLRGTTPPPPYKSTNREDGATEKRHRDNGGDPGRDARKRRRLAGEDDTDRDIRLARRDTDDVAKQRNATKSLLGEDVDAPIEDHAGHIQLFAAPPLRSARTAKNEEAEAERRKKEREMEDQYTMRFSNAAGFNKGVKDQPWYVGAASRTYENGDKQAKGAVSSGLDAFGREDAGRVRRDEKRLSSADPMAMMKQAQTQLKQVEREKEMWKRERDRETRSAHDTPKSRRGRTRHKEHDRHGDAGLEEFGLNGPAISGSKRLDDGERYGGVARNRRRPDQNKQDSRRHVRSDHRQHDTHGERHQHMSDRRNSSLERSGSARHRLRAY